MELILSIKYWGDERGADFSVIILVPSNYLLSRAAVRFLAVPYSTVKYIFCKTWITNCLSVIQKILIYFSLNVFFFFLFSLSKNKKNDEHTQAHTHTTRPQVKADDGKLSPWRL